MMVPTVLNSSRTPPGGGWDGSATCAPHGALIAEVDAAVRSVLATRGRGAEGDRPADADGAKVFAGRLFALRHAEALAGATREVRVAAGTVVTPLARDLLRKRGIAIRLVSKAEVARFKHPGEWGFTIASEDPAESGMIAALRRAWLEDDWMELEASLDLAARWVIEDPHRGALVVSDEASVAVWRACQIAGVRAASVHEPDAVARAVRRLGVNVLVVEPSGKSISWMRQLGLTFRRGGAPVSPGEFEREDGCP
jgi:hypothetical protein